MGSPNWLRWAWGVFVDGHIRLHEIVTCVTGVTFEGSELATNKIIYSGRLVTVYNLKRKSF